MTAPRWLRRCLRNAKTPLAHLAWSLGSGIGDDCRGCLTASSFARADLRLRCISAFSSPPNKALGLSIRASIALSPDGKQPLVECGKALSEAR